MNKSLRTGRAVAVLMLLMLGAAGLCSPAGYQIVAATQKAAVRTGIVKSPDQPRTVTRTMSPEPSNATGSLRLAQSMTSKRKSVAAPLTTPSLSIMDQVLFEPYSGEMTGTVLVKLSAPTTEPVVVNVSFGGTATRGVDYSPLFDAVRIDAGSIEGHVVIKLLSANANDVDAEETITLTLSGATNATIADGQGTVVILPHPKRVEEENENVFPPIEAQYRYGFESLYFDPRWNLYTSGGAGRVQLNSAVGALSPTQALLMDSDTPGQYALTEAIMEFRYDANRAYRLKFWHKSMGDEPHAMPQSFTGHHNSDGVAISQDQITWYRLENLSSATETNFTEHVIDLDETVSQRGLSFSAPLFIKFQQYDNNPYTAGDGRVFDDVELTSAAFPSLTIDDTTVVEGPSGTNRYAVVTLNLSKPSAEWVAVKLGLSGGTATQSVDYAFYANSDVCAFPPGTTTFTTAVRVTGDDSAEPDETFNMSLSAPSNANIEDDFAVCTILDDDVSRVLSVSDVALVEGNSGSKNATFTITLSHASGQSISVDYATVDGTATAGSDYTAKSGTLVFGPGVTTQTVDVPVTGDTLFELDESFRLVLSNPVNAALGDSSGTGTITNDDAGVQLGLSNVTVNEGDGGTVSADFTVTLSAPAGVTVQVDYITANGTALAGTDYTATSGTVTFAPGQTLRTVSVPIIGDLVEEGTETFSLNFSNAVNATLPVTQATGTITDDDLVPKLSVDDVANYEGAVFRFTVSLSPAPLKPVTVQYQTVDGTATANSDFSARTGTLSFVPGQTANTVDVLTNNDLLVEPDETFKFVLSNPTGAILEDAEGTGTLYSEDLSRITFPDPKINEGNVPTRTFPWPVALHQASFKTVTVDYVIVAGTAGAGTDFQPTDGTLTFAPGDTLKTIPITLLGDTAVEGDESFSLKLSNPVNATLPKNTGTCTILDDDVPVISINNVNVSEGNSGTQAATFTATLSAASTKPVTVNYNSASQTAISGVDFNAVTGTLTFDPGVTSQPVSVPVIGDTAREDDETFLLQLSQPVNATITAVSGVGTIVDDDSYVLTIGDITAKEGSVSVGSNAVFTVTLSKPSSTTISVKYTTSSGTAISGTDFTSTSGTLNFSPGSTTEKITVPLFGDTEDEPDETFTVSLSQAVGAAIGDDTATGTIQNDDVPPALSINDVSISEGDTGEANAVFTVQLSARSGRSVTVNYVTNPGTATVPADYKSVAGTLTFTPGVTSQDIAVPIVGDRISEPQETFTVLLSAAVNASIIDEQGKGTINDNDLVSISLSNVNLVEGDSGTTPLTFTLSLSNASSQPITVLAVTSNGTATAGRDYTARNSTITINPGLTNQTIVVPIIGDLSDEEDEKFTLTLSNAVGAILNTTQVVGTIVDNDSLPVFSVDDVTVTEGHSGAVQANFTVKVFPVSGKSVTVNYATSNGTATAPDDYTAASGALTFAPGEATKTVSVSVLGDTWIEGTETFNLTLSSPTNAMLGDDKGVGTITDDDFNAPPVNVSVTPGSGTAPTGTPISLTAIYRDTDGVNDLRKANLLISTDGATQNALLVTYDVEKNLLYLRNDTDSGWLPELGIKPGSAALVQNSQGTLDISKTSVTRDGTDLTVTWTFIAKLGFTGLRKVLLFCEDAAGATDGWEALGNWTFTEPQFTIAGVCKSMRPNATYDGILRAPLQNAVVVLKDSSNRVVAITSSDSSGAYRIANVPRGQYIVSATFTRDGITVGMDPPTQAVTVKNANIAVARFALYSLFGVVRAPRLDGTVTGRSGAVVKLINKKGVVLATRSTDSLGRFEFRNYWRGEFQLKAELPGFAFPVRTRAVPSSGLPWSPAAQAGFLGQRSPTLISPSGAVF